ncbi:MULTISPECIES: PKD domain-containing protein [Methanocalculus]|uniref:PKD domain-containing protein n=1 Tax=Methanocalculus TaxID=71151 RepID=UPI0020A1D57B|nr:MULTISPECIES: PKD domain-containing protein [unclassified Methanocalculus]MCP1662316.1 PKD repeat protein [Methanocalculus sp. AMF5]
MVGTLILSVLVILVISIVGVSFLSQEPSPEVPALRIDLAEKQEAITLIHRGGDTLYRDTTRITVDGEDKTGDFETLDGLDWETFAVGDWLTIPGSNATGASIQIIHTAPAIPTLLFSIKGVRPPLPDPPVADFIGTPTTGLPNLTVQFTDLSTGNPTSWTWNFGDGSSSTQKNPVHTYTAPGNYTVTLVAGNAGGTQTITRPGYIHVQTPAEYIAEESVFVYGTKLFFEGNSVTGINSTIIITGDLDTADVNLGAGLFVSKIFINGSTIMNTGSASLGNPDFPDIIVINGDLELWDGTRDIYGDVYVNGHFRLKDARIHHTVYVNGDLELGWTPWLADDARIYYTGSFTHPPTMPQHILDKCIHQATVPTESIPNLEMPALKEESWYHANGYVSEGALTDDLKIYAPNYVGTFSWDPDPPPYENVIIIAHSGDITIPSLGAEKITGVLFAPFGRVAVQGARFEGVVLARDGFFMTQGGSDVVFTNLMDFFDDEEDWPFV